MRRVFNYKITLSVLALFAIIIVSIIILTKHNISLIGAELTEKELYKDLKILGGEELKIKYITVYFNGDIPNQTVTEKNGSIDRSDRIINITSSNKKLWTKITSPYEINQGMRTWLYIKDRKLPFEIAGVYSQFQEKGMISEIKEVLISKTEFEELFREVYQTELSEDQLITELSDLWISKTNHKKWWAD